MLARLAAELQRDGQEALRGRLADGASGLDPARERDLVDQWVLDERPAGRRRAPVMTLRTPGGKPTESASSATASIDADVTSEGFTTTVFPAASAGAAAIIVRNTGEFHGVTIADDAERLRDGVVEDALAVEWDRACPRPCRPSRRSSGSTSARAGAATSISLKSLPLSRVSSEPMRSESPVSRRRAGTAAARARSQAATCHAGASNASRARRTHASTSSAEATATRAHGLPVVGSTVRSERRCEPRGARRL